MAVLIDTNILLALGSPKDANHDRARMAMREIREDRIISAAVLPELFYMMSVRVSYQSAVRFFGILQSAAFQIETLLAADMVRMQEIMTEYQDNAFDFVDVSIMALAERLNIPDIYTLDQRDFLVFRPRHYPHLRLLP
jgi:uncharacterized protein